jgi:hypothetical protein
VSHEVTLLEELLARVQRNAALPRVASAPPVPPAAFAAAPLAPPSAPRASAPAWEAPATYTEPPLDSSPEFESEPMFEAPAPAVAYDATFESDHPPVAAHVAPLDQSVDEMLLADPFPSIPAPPIAQQSLTDMLDEDEPIPLVSVASPLAIAKEDISAVMSRSDLSHDVPEELLEDDIVEMSPSEGEAVVPASNHDLDDLNFDDEDTDHNRELSEPPASSSRHKVAGSMDEALARAAEQIELEEGREVPLKTPPPESGPQAAMALPAGIHAPLAPDIEELLEADIMPVGGVNAAVPRPEQLGQTIDLEEARGPHLELDSALAAPPAPLQEELPSEELEVTLPRREFGGGYQDDLMPPPEARQELDAHRERFGDIEHEAPPPESLAQYPSQQPPPESGFAPVLVPASVTTDSHSESVSTVTVDAPPHAEFAPELLMRPEQSPSPVAKFIRVQPPRPNTFLELLDASLGLGRN